MNTMLHTNWTYAEHMIDMWSNLAKAKSFFFICQTMGMLEAEQ